MTVKVTHRNYEIVLDEVAEIWSCEQFGLADKSLLKLKKAIDRESKKTRTMKLPALRFFGHWRAAELTDVTITLILDNGRAAKIIDHEGDNVQVDIDNLYQPEQRDALLAYIALRKAADLAADKADDAWSKIEPLDAAKIRELAVRQAEENAA